MNAPDSRAEETRRRLIAAGLELFSRHGYDAVTTRQLADAAGVNQATIPYHFGGKEGVYRAVAEEVATAAGARIRPLAESARLRLAADPEPPALGALLLETTLAVARAVFAGELRGVWPLFLAREQFGQSAAFARLYDEFAGPVHVLVGELIARLTGTPAESPDNIRLTHAYLGQILAFASTHATLDRRLGRCGDFAADEADAVIAAIERFSALAIAGMLAGA